MANLQPLEPSLYPILPPNFLPARLGFEEPGFEFDPVFTLLGLLSPLFTVTPVFFFVLSFTSSTSFLA